MLLYNAQASQAWMACATQKQPLSSRRGFNHTDVRNVKEANMPLCQGMLKEHLQNAVLQAIRANSEAWSMENRQLCF